MIKLLQNFLVGIFILVLVATIGLFVVSLLPIPGNIEIKIVQSGSMEPAINTGGIVIVKPVQSYEVGDVITFGEDSRTAIPTTHRITAKRTVGSNVYYQTKGDANEEADLKETRHEDILGKVLFDVPHVGYILSFAREPLGFILLIAMPAGLVILYELVNIWQEIRRYLARRREPEEAT